MNIRIKTIVGLHTVIALLLLHSCKDKFFTELDNPSDISTNEKLHSVINGAKATLNLSHYWESYWYIMNNADELTYGVRYFGYKDEIKDRNTPFDIFNYSNLKIVYLKGFGAFETENIYAPLYEGIITLNRVLLTDDNSYRNMEHMHIIGEAYLFRAYFYFLLVRVYNHIPLITNIDVNYEIKLSGPGDIYNLILSDLNKAIDKLPDYANSELMYSRYSAKTVLAQVYMFMGGYPLYDTDKYSLAVNVCSEIMASNTAALEPDFKELLKYGNNNENVFSMYINEGLEGFQEIAGFYNIPEFEFYNSFPSNYRKRTLLKTAFIDTRDLSTNNLLPATPLVYEIKEMPNNIGPKAAVVFDLHSLKYPITVTNNRTNNHFNINFFRYAHVLLAYAECKARIGEVDQSAYNAINVIRRRANKLPISEVSAFDLQQGLTPQQFVDSVIAERRWELCAEPEGRWFDIVRLQLLNQINEARHTGEFIFEPRFSSQQFPYTSYFATIPESEFYLNLNLK